MYFYFVLGNVRYPILLKYIKNICPENITFYIESSRSGNIGGRCHSEREKLGPCFPTSYTIAINETVR